jgi:hypothetical protein
VAALRRDAPAHIANNIGLVLPRAVVPFSTHSHIPQRHEGAIASPSVGPQHNGRATGPRVRPRNLVYHRFGAAQPVRDVT